MKKGVMSRVCTIQNKNLTFLGLWDAREFADWEGHERV